jgi:hypothetical protein
MSARCTCDPGPEGQHRDWCATEHGEVIDAEVTSEGQVLIAAAETVAFLRRCAEHYASGGSGGSEDMQRGAEQALRRTADDLQTECIDVAADALTDRWWRS